MPRRTAVLLALVLTGAGGYALAQGAAPAPQPPAAGAGAPAEAPRAPRFGRAELDSFADARIAAIQAGLRLTPEQQKLWPPLEQALRAEASDRIGRMERMREAREARRGGDRPDFMERVDRRAAMSAERAQRAAALQSALKPLWATLDERQKRVLPALMREGRGMRHAWRMQRGGMDHHHGMGRGGHHGGPERGERL